MTAAAGRRTSTPAANFTSDRNSERAPDTAADTFSEALAETVENRAGAADVDPNGPVDPDFVWPPAASFRKEPPRRRGGIWVLAVLLILALAAAGLWTLRPALQALGVAPATVARVMAPLDPLRDQAAAWLAKLTEMMGRRRTAPPPAVRSPRRHQRRHQRPQRRPRRHLGPARRRRPPTAKAESLAEVPPPPPVADAGQPDPGADR